MLLEESGQTLQRQRVRLPLQQLRLQQRRQIPVRFEPGRGAHFGQGKFALLGGDCRLGDGEMRLRGLGVGLGQLLHQFER